jgi:hypothetical protein
MANLVIDPTLVIASSGASTLKSTAGETILAGQPVYKADGSMFLGDANDPEKIDIAGIALHNASLGQPLSYVVSDEALEIGADVGVGFPYVLGDEPGDISGVADLAPGHFTVMIGVGRPDNKLHINFASPSPLRSDEAIGSGEDPVAP